jgi:biopolymer transport protein TolR
MAISVGGEHVGRRRGVDAALNLVPYIDLLTCMIAFLLITSAWLQLARLSVAQKGESEDGEHTGRDGPRIAVLVHADGFNVVVKDQETVIPKRAGAMDFQALAARLQRVKEAHPDTIDARILADDGVVFEIVVGSMDAAMAAGFVQLSLLDAVP